MTVSKDSICKLLQECIQKKDVADGRSLHSLIISQGLSELNILNDHLIRLFSICGTLFEANLVFCNMKDPSVFSWEAIISAHIALKEQETALALYQDMGIEGIIPNRCVFLTLFKACGVNGKGVVQGRRIHEEIIKSGFDSDKVVINTLIDMYAKLGRLDEAQKLFDMLSTRDVVSFGALITGYTLYEHGLLALKLFERLQREGQRPDKVTFLAILKACGTEAAIIEGRFIHNEIIQRDLQSDVLIGSSLLDMYAKSGSLEEAQKVFDALPHRTIVSWGALIAGYTQHGHGEAALKIYENMLSSGTRPDKVTFLCTLKACGSAGAIAQGRFLHDQIIRNDYLKDAAIGSTLIDMYSNCGGLSEASRVFESASVKDVVIWSAMIAAYTQHGHGDVAFEVFQEMLKSSRQPNNATYAVVLKACGSVKNITQGQMVYDQVIRSSVDSDMVVCSAVVDMYCKCGSLQEASKVFETISNQDVVLWGSLIAGYAQHGFGLPALLLFEKMQKKGLKPSGIIFSSILKACTSIGALEEGRLIYDQIVKNKHEGDIVIGNTLVDLFSSCESLEEAHKVFDRSVHLDRISWNALIAGYTRHRHGAAALELFGKMKKQGMSPDKVTFSCVLKACGSMGAITSGKLVHDLVLRDASEGDVVVGTTLIDMYGTCGKLGEARKVFDSLLSKNSVSWCALIAGYVQHDRWRLALDCIHEMQSQGFKLDDRIHTIMLTACSHLGELQEGHWYLRSIVAEEGCTTLSIQHINCMIDLCGRHGQLQDAVELLKAMPSSLDTAGWMSVLTACKNFNNEEVGSHCLDQISHLDFDLPSAFMFMSNIYADANMLKKVSKVQLLRRFANAWKMPGKACIEVGDEVHELVVGDETCMLDSEVAIKIERLTKLIEGGGYMPNLDGVMEPSLREVIDL